MKTQNREEKKMSLSLITKKQKAAGWSITLESDDNVYYYDRTPDCYHLSYNNKIIGHIGPDATRNTGWTAVLEVGLGVTPTWRNHRTEKAAIAKIIKDYTAQVINRG